MLMMSLLLLLFQYKPVQTWAARKAANYLAGELHTKIDIKSLYIKPFSSVVLEGLYVLDKQNDTLLNAPKFAVELNGFSLFSSIKKRYIDFKTIELDNGSFYLKKLKDSSSNLKFIVDYFNQGPPTKTKTKPWTIRFDSVVINNFHFRYKNQLKHAVTTSVVNFNDVDVQHFSGTVSNLDLKNHLFKANLRHLTLKEKSGFNLLNLSAVTTIDTNQILLQNMAIRTPQSHLRDYFRMKFKSFTDFDDFENKVYMDGDFKSSRLSSRDVSYFTSSLGKTQFDLGVQGRIRGWVNNLSAKNLLVTGGQATYVKGNFSLRGLPDWENTFLELQFEQIATNKKDLDYLYGRFIGNPGKGAPAILGKFGNINFTGRFTGLQNDFVTYGTFKTSLGQFDSDINLKISKNGFPSYSGKINTQNFDIGALVNEKSLGRATLSADVKGSGDEIKNFSLNGNAKIRHVEYNGYNYQNITFNGGVKQKQITGRVKINDQNLKLDITGGINFNPALPVYTVAGNISTAKLHWLKLLNDTIDVSTQINGRISGNSLNNIEGNLRLEPMRIADPRHDYLVDSIVFNASGIGKSRQIDLKSSIADASIKGNYDLGTIPSYFKTIVKQYIPSLKTHIVKPGNEDFTFNLQLKNLDPVTAIFAPNLKIPDQGNILGKFNSATHTAQLNGYIKTIRYGKTVLHDLILDESTAPDELDLNVSLSKVNFTDSLFIKNISITNFLRKDSLNFNVKLSDKNATNQLDLYGLVKFGRDTTARLNILPSDVILEHQTWRINEKVRIRLMGDRTEVQGFELANGAQRVRIDGFISPNPADQLKVEFNKFSMATFNQLTKSGGILLSGTLNGKVLLNSVTKSPAINSDLGVDSLSMNKTLIGNVKLATNMDNTQQLANVKLNILKAGLETINIKGAYNLGSNTDNLDFDIRMDQAEAVIFQPFVKGLVSNLKGTVSTDLKLTGTPSKPALNGNITLANTGVTVDYLKTSYLVNDKLSVNNSVVKVDNMILKDYRGGEGTANGTVDLNDISNPDIEIDLVARDLMALNTTFKDNRLYYGKAYASGNFSFKGPVDNMQIDIKARTQDSTVFNIPLNTSSTASQYEFIRFVSHKDTNQVVQNTRAFNGVTLNFDLTADEKTLVKIATDYGELEGRGTANDLSLKINSLGDFDMYGDFLISSGKFEFTAKNFVSKIFQVTQGGTIRWTGNPNNADINLQALYEVRTDVNNLYSAAGMAYTSGNQEKLVDAKLLIKGSLLQPSIDFDFDFPTDPSIKDELGTYLADVNNRNQQAISLIVRRQFAPGTGTNINKQVLGTAQDAVSEFFFNKVNSIIAQSNIKYFDLNIRSQNDASASLKFFNDRLIFNGSLYNNNGTNDLFNNSSSLFNSNFNNLTKDFDAEYLIRADGRLRARYSYRVLNSTTLNNIGSDQFGIQYVNGLGLVYQRDFDSFGEFIKYIFKNPDRRRNQTPKNTPKSNGATTNQPATQTTGTTNNETRDEEERD